MPARTPHPLARLAAASLGPLVAFAVTSGCGPKGDPATPTPPSSAEAGVVDAAVAPPIDVGVAIPDVTPVADTGVGPALPASADAMVAAPVDAAPPPCWKGWVPTGNAGADVVSLGGKCAAGMTMIGQPVKHTFKAGESKSFPTVPFMVGCYRIIAVGGTGVKDVDLMLKDASGKIVAADLTPDDVFPMIHPNREFCVEAFQFLNVSIVVKKGAGEVAGGVWKR